MGQNVVAELRSGLGKKKLEWNRNLLEFSNVCHRVHRVSKMYSNGNFDIRKENIFWQARNAI
jgi:hypothetical protein